MNVKQKDIVLLPYPFTDLVRTKVRPAIVVSNNNFNEESADCLMVPITSVLKETPHSVMIKQEDMVSGKLLKPSKVQINKIFTVEKRLVIMKIGSISDFLFKKIKSGLIGIID